MVAFPFFVVDYMDIYLGNIKDGRGCRDLIAKSKGAARDVVVAWGSSPPRWPGESVPADGRRRGWELLLACRPS